jgi:hypothetical protein
MRTETKRRTQGKKKKARKTGEELNEDLKVWEILLKSRKPEDRGKLVANGASREKKMFGQPFICCTCWLIWKEGDTINSPPHSWSSSYSSLSINRPALTSSCQRRLGTSKGVISCGNSGSSEVSCQGVFFSCPKDGLTLALRRN